MSRVDSLPPATRSPTVRSDPSRGGRTGAEKLQQLGKGRDVEFSKDDHYEDEAGGVEGFESPQQAKARAQVCTGMAGENHITRFPATLEAQQPLDTSAIFSYVRLRLLAGYWRFYGGCVR